EVDLMKVLAKRLKVKAEFVQSEWTTLPDLLRTGGIDVIVNGYERTPERQQSMLATIPYYIYELQLIARRDDASITSWDDLARDGGERKKIGVLVGSSAEKYVRDRLGDRVEIVPYNGSTDAMQEVETGKLDATVQDLPPAIFYRERYQKLHFVGAPVGRGYYVMYVRRGDERLRNEINDVITDLSPSGPSLKTIYKRYGIWNETHEQLGSRPEEESQGSTQVHGWEVVWRNL